MALNLLLNINGGSYVNLDNHALILLIFDGIEFIIRNLLVNFVNLKLYLFFGNVCWNSFHNDWVVRCVGAQILNLFDLSNFHMLKKKVGNHDDKNKNET